MFGTLSYDAITLAIRNMDDSLPNNIRQVQGPIKIFYNLLLDFAYAVIGKIPYEDYPVKDFYRVFRHFDSFQSTSEIRFGSARWIEMYINLNSLRFNAILHHQLFLQAYIIDHHRTNLKSKKLIDDDRCMNCGMSETLFHKLIVRPHKDRYLDQIHLHL